MTLSKSNSVGEVSRKKVKLFTPIFRTPDKELSFKERSSINNQRKRKEQFSKFLERKKEKTINDKIRQTRNQIQQNRVLFNKSKLKKM